MDGDESSQSSSQQYQKPESQILPIYRNELRVLVVDECHGALETSISEDGRSCSLAHDGHDSPVRSVTSSSSFSEGDSSSDSDVEVVDEEDDDDENSTSSIQPPPPRSFHIGRTSSVAPGLGTLWPPRNNDNFARGKQVPPYARFLNVILAGNITCMCARAPEQLLKSLEMDPLTFSRDDLVHLTLEIFLEASTRRAINGAAGQRSKRKALAAPEWEANHQRAACGSSPLAPSLSQRKCPIRAGTGAWTGRGADSGGMGGGGGDARPGSAERRRGRVGAGRGARAVGPWPDPR